MIVCTANVHADFRAGITAQDGAVVDESGACPPSGGGEGRAKSGHFPTGNDDVMTLVCAFQHVLSSRLLHEKDSIDATLQIRRSCEYDMLQDTVQP